MAGLSLEQKVALLSGMDVWRTAPIADIELPPIKVSDGPNGVRGDSTTGARAVCLPASIALGASFDVDLVTELGRLLGRETVRKGAQVLLAPTINLARHPLGGRNFESFGEEPLLTAPLGAAYIRGVQDEGVGACAKHFVANDVEDSRLTVSSIVDDQTLREVYLVPFEAAVDAGVWSLMAAYPKLNGAHCTEHPWLLTTLLREEWGFDGLVMSDWGATHHPTRSLVAGLDLEMPGPPRAYGPKLLAALDRGEIDVEVIDRRAESVVDLAIRADRIGRDEDSEQSVDLPEERALVRRAAADGMVLLTNRQGADGGRALPLPAGIGSVAVIGPNAETGVIQGGGSAQLLAHHVVAPIDGIRAALPDAAVELHRGCLAHRYLPDVAADRWVDGTGDGAGGGGGARPLAIEVFDNPELDGAPVVERTGRRLGAFFHGGHADLPDVELWSQRWTGRLRVDETGRHEFGVLAVGRARVFVDGALVVDNWTAPRPGEAYFGKASLEETGTIELTAGTEAEVVVEWSGGDDIDLAGLRFGMLAPIDQDALLDEAVAAAAGADAAVVVVGLTAEWETEGHDRVMFELPRRQDELVARVAAANPRTVVVVNAGGPVDMPWLDDVAAALMVWYPGQEFGGALADVLLGHTDPGGRLPVTFPGLLDKTPTVGLVPGDGTTLRYGEGLFLGHRWYAANDVEPRLPFGHGLSYAEFVFGPAAVRSGDGETTTVTVPVTNAGSVAGKCVPQLYLRPEADDRPRVLAGFAAARIDAGATVEVEIEVDARALRRWDGDGDGWRPLTGEHRLELATSATTTVETLPLTVA